MGRINFENFLCGEMARDYVFQEQPYEDQIRQAAALIREADHILIGAGAGMSTAAGAQYGGQWFQEHFSEFIDKYDSPYMSDMYSAGFYPYPDEEAYWGYWSRQAICGGVELDITPLHKVVLDMLGDRNVFCLSTNADAQFVKAGLSENRIFCTQGDYFHIQCARGCHQQTYDAVGLFQQMDAARTDCMIPTELVPKCPVCGGRMNMNLRIDRYFVQDDGWYAAEWRFSDFLDGAVNSGEKICLLELGVGFNTPTIIRFPFEKLVREHSQITLVRLNLKEAMVPAHFGDRAVGINDDIARAIRDLAAEI